MACRVRGTSSSCRRSGSSPACRRSTCVAKRNRPSHSIDRSDDLLHVLDFGRMPSAQIVLAFMCGFGLGAILAAFVTYRLVRAGRRADALREADGKRYAELTTL